MRAVSSSTSAILATAPMLATGLRTLPRCKFTTGNCAQNIGGLLGQGASGQEVMPSMVDSSGQGGQATIKDKAGGGHVAFNRGLHHAFQNRGQLAGQCFPELRGLTPARWAAPWVPAFSRFPRLQVLCVPLFAFCFSSDRRSLSVTV